MTPPQPLKSVMAGTIKPQQLVAHQFALDETRKAYDSFDDAGRQHALKIILSNAPDGMA